MMTKWKRYFKLSPAAIVCFTVIAFPAAAVDDAKVERATTDQLIVKWTSKTPVDVYVTGDPAGTLTSAKLLSSRDMDGAHLYSDSAYRRPYFLLHDSNSGAVTAVAERLFPLEQGSNFRDIGGYTGAQGKKVRWGKIFRSGALPVLTDNDYRLVEGLGIESIIDFRSLDEREVAPTLLDDRTGALFLANDYALKPLMEAFAKSGGDNMYAEMEKALAPQYRMLFKRMLADDGAVLYHCSAGQDRTGIATALVLSALGVDRETILADYHLSTPSRRPEWELPKIDPADYPDNLIVQYYAAAAKKPGGAKAEPLYGTDGQSHLVKFFAHLEKQYGGVEAYLDKELGVRSSDIAKLRSIYLQ